MLGPRTRAAAQRESACAEPQVDPNDNGDVRKSKRTKKDALTHALTSSSAEAAVALATSNLYACVPVMTKIAHIRNLSPTFLVFGESMFNLTRMFHKFACAPDFSVSFEFERHNMSPCGTHNPQSHLRNHNGRRRHCH